MEADDHALAVQTTAAAFAQAIDALRSDDVEVAACILGEIEVAMSTSSLGAGVELLSELWRTAQEEAALAAVRLQARATHHGNSQRAVRAYR